METSKIKYRHFREYIQDKIAQHGGVSIAIYRYDKYALVGIAICSNKDNFSKKSGRNIATVRLNLERKVIDIKDVKRFLETKHYNTKILNTKANDMFIQTLKFSDISDEVIFKTVRFLEKDVV